MDESSQLLFEYPIYNFDLIVQLRVIGGAETKIGTTDAEEITPKCA